MNLDTSQVKAVYLTAEDLKMAASILYKAYHDDPLFQKIFHAQDDGYDSRLRAAIKEELNAFWQSQQTLFGLFEQERMLATACVQVPGHPLANNRYWHWRMKMLLTAGWFGTGKWIEKEKAVRDSMPVEVYHMIAFLAVEPGEQQHGLGHMLLHGLDNLVRDSATSQGIGVFVTLNKFLPFFEHAGYDEVKQITVGDINGYLLFKPR